MRIREPRLKKQLEYRRGTSRAIRQRRWLGRYDEYRSPRDKAFRDSLRAERKHGVPDIAPEMAIPTELYSVYRHELDIIELELHDSGGVSCALVKMEPYDLEP